MRNVIERKYGIFWEFGPLFELQFGNVSHVVLQREDLRRRYPHQRVPHREGNYTSHTLYINMTNVAIF